MTEPEPEKPMSADDPTREQREAVLEILRKADGAPLADIAEVIAFAMWSREREARRQGYDEGRRAGETCMLIRAREVDR